MKKRCFYSSICFYAVFAILPAAVLPNLLSLAYSDSMPAAAAGWDRVPGILREIVPPEFPSGIFNITDYGAARDGKTDCTLAFKRAIEACHQAGGGLVLVPEGIYLTGSIHLKGNINLHVSQNATILFSTDPDDYLPVVLTRFEGVECMNFSPFIYAYEEENIAITGNGTLDGQAGPDAWWPWKGRTMYGWKNGEPNQEKARDKLFLMAEKGVPVKQRIFGKNNYLRPSFIQLYKCKNILIDSVTIIRSPMWEIHPVLSENITVQNVKIMSHGPNNDGCNPESSKNVLIRKCYFDTGDDCIAIKSGRNADGRRLKSASENIIVQDCVMKEGHGGLVIGSEISGDCRNVYLEDCRMDSPHLQWAFRIKTNSVRGGLIENIYMRDVAIGQVSDAILRVNFNYEEGDAGQYTPTVRNIHLTNITSSSSRYAISITGYERSPVQNLTIENCRFNGVEDGNQIRNGKNLRFINVYINGELQKSE